VLRKLGKKPFEYRKGMKNYVRIVGKPFTADRMNETCSETERQVMREAMRCRFCEHPSCTGGGESADVRGIMRRVAVGNFTGAKKLWSLSKADIAMTEKYESGCICSLEKGEPVKIREVVSFLGQVTR